MPLVKQGNEWQEIRRRARCLQALERPIASMWQALADHGVVGYRHSGVPSHSLH
jgi:hypothetical protein